MLTALHKSTVTVDIFKLIDNSSWLKRQAFLPSLCKLAGVGIFKTFKDKTMLLDEDDKHGDNNRL